jgi:hypothetical protein
MSAKKGKNVATAPEPLFEPVAYKLNWRGIEEVPAVILDDSGKRQTTVGGVLREAMPLRFGGDGKDEPVPETAGDFGLTIKKTAGGTIRLDHSDAWFGGKLVTNVLHLMRLTGGSLLSPTLFYYAHDRWYGHETFGDHYRFFVVVADAIVDENFVLSSLFGGKVYANVLEPEDDGAGASPSDDDWLRRWYQRFYTETRSGKALVLRDDRTPIYHYVAPERREAERDARETERDGLLTAVTLLLSSTTRRLARLEVLFIVVVLTWLVRGCVASR